MTSRQRIAFFIALSLWIGWVLLRGDDQARATARNQSKGASPVVQRDGQHASHPAPAPSYTLVAQWRDRPPVEPATRNPFAPTTEPTSAASPAPPPVTRAEPPPPPPTPVPQPVLDVQFRGQIAGPDGRTLFASVGDQYFQLAVGTSLPNGFKVTEINETAVQFVHPSGPTASLAIPPLPRFEVR